MSCFAHYFSNIKAAILEAVRKQILQRSSAAGVSIVTEETSRVYLTLPESRSLQRTQCDNQEVKDAFLFSAFSGMRYSDVKRLTWEKVETDSLEFVR